MLFVMYIENNLRKTVISKNILKIRVHLKEPGSFVDTTWSRIGLFIYSCLKTEMGYLPNSDKNTCLLPVMKKEPF